MKKWHDDPFTKKARKENFEARSVYKLEEIDSREKVFERARTVVDLGASPGSWTQYVVRKRPDATVYAVDLNPLNFTHPRVKFFQQDIETLDWSAILGDTKADAVISDMAPKTSGIRDRDTALSFELAALAVQTAKSCLVPDGKFVVKIFMGDTFAEFEKLMKETFKTFRRLRPETTRKHSKEIYYIGHGLRIS